MQRHAHPLIRRAHRIVLTWLLACASGYAPCVGAQTQGVPSDRAMPALVAAAERIVVADLVEMPARRSARDNRIVTDYHFSATRTLFGQPPSTDLVLSQDGGSMDGETQERGDAPAFVLGARYLLFLRPGSGELLPSFVGGTQGVYRLSIDGKALALGGEREILKCDDLLTEIDRLVAARRTPESVAPAQRAAERRGSSSP
ncbi:MAG: hypothetical protein ABI843_08285 [Dokdonella sp.]